MTFVSYGLESLVALYPFTLDIGHTSILSGHRKTSTYIKVCLSVLSQETGQTELRCEATSEAVDEPVYKVITVDVEEEVTTMTTATETTEDIEVTTPKETTTAKELLYESVEVESNDVQGNLNDQDDHDLDFEENESEEARQEYSEDSYEYDEEENYFYEYPEHLPEDAEDDLLVHPELAHEDLYRNYGQKNPQKKNSVEEEMVETNQVYPKDSPYRSSSSRTATSLTSSTWLALLLIVTCRSQRWLASH